METQIIKATDQERVYRSKHYHDIRAVKNRQLVCCSCGNSVLVEKDIIFSHPVVGILQCEKCYERFKDVDLTKKNCRVCGKTKNLHTCENKKCTFVFCRSCIKRNASLSLLHVDAGTWRCFACDSKPLWELRAVSALVMSSLPRSKRKKYSRQKETGTVSSYARHKSAKAQELKMRSLCDDDTSTTEQEEDDQEPFGTHKEELIICSSDSLEDLSHFSSDDKDVHSRKHRRTKTACSEMSDENEKNVKDKRISRASKRGKRSPESELTRKDGRRRSKSLANRLTNIVVPKNARKANSTGRRSASLLRDGETGSSSGKEFQKSKFSHEGASTLRKLRDPRRQNTRETLELKDEEKVVIRKQERLKFKTKVMKSLNRFKDVCLEVGLHIEHLKRKHFKKELIYRENADLIVHKSRNVINKLKEELERQEKELVRFHKTWSEWCDRKNEKGSSFSSENDLSAKEEEGPEKISANKSKGISVSECDSEEIFSEKEGLAKEGKDVNNKSTLDESADTSSEIVMSPVLGSTRKPSAEVHSKARRDKERSSSPISQNPCCNDSVADMFETTTDEDTATRKNQNSNNGKEDITEKEEAVVSSAEKNDNVQVEESEKSGQLETVESSKSKRTKQKMKNMSEMKESLLAEDTLDEEERAKKAMLDSDTDLPDDSVCSKDEEKSNRTSGEKSKDEEEKNEGDDKGEEEETAKSALLESDDSSSMRHSALKESDTENFLAKKALLISSNSESSSSESARGSETVAKSKENDKDRTKRNRTSSDTSGDSHVKRRRLKMDMIRHPYGNDEKLKMTCQVAVESLPKHVLKKFAKVLEKSRQRLDRKNLASLIDLEKLERKRNVDSSVESSSGSSRKQKGRKDTKDNDEEDESLLDHLKRVENGERTDTSDEETFRTERKASDTFDRGTGNIQTKEELMREADRAAKDILLNSSDSDLEKLGSGSEKSDSDNDKKSSKSKNGASQEKEKDAKDEKNKEDTEKSRWRRNKILRMKLSDSNSETEKEKWKIKQEKLRAKEEDEDDDDNPNTDVKEVRSRRKTKLRRRIIDSDSDEDVQTIDQNSDSSVMFDKDNDANADGTGGNGSDDGGSSVSSSSKKKKKQSGRKRATLKSSDTDSSIEEKKPKPKRRRIKKMASDSENDSDHINSSQGTPGKKGRKNIRKVIKDKQVADDTRQAAKEEEERLRRIAEREKLYEEMHEARLANEEKVEKIVLDFDPETKEELVTVHPALVKQLKPHQAEGIKFMWNSCFESLERVKTSRGSGCILAHCMGLGKTLQVISLVHTLLTYEATGINTVMVVCPLSTVLNWIQEFNIWLKGVENSSDIELYELTKYKKNIERKYQLQSWQRTGGVLIIGYEMFRNLCRPNRTMRKNMKEAIHVCLVDPGPDLVICDEGHLLKNEDTALSKCMTSIRTLRRIVLTGTPLQNNLIEYHCMVQFVKPNLLGTKREFLNRFVNPITNGQFDDSTERDVKLMKKRAYVLHKMLKGSVQRFDYSVLMPFLPPKQEYVIFVRLTDEQIKMYRHYLENFARRHRGAGGSLFADFQALQRIWTHPLVLKLNAEKVEKNERKRLSSDSEGSLRDFIADDSETESSSSSSSDSESSDNSNSHGKNSKQTKGNGEGDDDENEVQEITDVNNPTTNRRSRRNQEASPAEEEDIEEEKQEESWWTQYVQPEHFDDIRASAKLILLFGILKECEQIGDKVLVFSQSLNSLTLIEMFLEKIDEATQDGASLDTLNGHTGSWSLGLDYFRLDGQTSPENRSAWCKIFNKSSNTRARLFLISTRAGGLGINLTAANRVIIFDASWNPSHDVQSIFRVYRFGQKKPSYVYRFLAAGTMEEKIYNRQVTKLSLSCRVVDEQQIERHYSNNDLNELYKFEPNLSDERPTLNLPKDRVLAEIFLKYKDHVDNYHEHDSLLENKVEEELNEEERKQAWLEYEEERKGRPVQPFVVMPPFQNNVMSNQYGIPQPNISIQDYENLQQLIRKDYPNATPEQQKAMTTRALMEMYQYWEKQAIQRQAVNTYNVQNTSRLNQMLVNPPISQITPHTVQNVNVHVVPNLCANKANEASVSITGDEDIVEVSPSTTVTLSQNPTNSKGKDQEE